MTANKERGEVELKLAGVSYVLRPSFEAIVAIEAETGRSTLELAQAATAGALPLNHAAIIAAECIKAEGRATKKTSLAGVNTDKIGKLIYGELGGLALANKTLQILLLLAVSGNYNAQGERNPREGEAQAAD